MVDVKTYLTSMPVGERSSKPAHLKDLGWDDDSVLVYTKDADNVVLFSVTDIIGTHVISPAFRAPLKSVNAQTIHSGVSNAVRADLVHIAYGFESYWIVVPHTQTLRQAITILMNDLWRVPELVSSFLLYSKYKSVVDGLGNTIYMIEFGAGYVRLEVPSFVKHQYAVGIPHMHHKKPA